MLSDGWIRRRMDKTPDPNQKVDTRRHKNRVWSESKKLLLNDCLNLKLQGLTLPLVIQWQWQWQLPSLLWFNNEEIAPLPFFHVTWLLVVANFRGEFVRCWWHLRRTGLPSMYMNIKNMNVNVNINTSININVNAFGKWWRLRRKGTPSSTRKLWFSPPPGLRFL